MTRVHFMTSPKVVLLQSQDCKATASNLMGLEAGVRRKEGMRKGREREGGEGRRGERQRGREKGGEKLSIK